MKPFLALLSIVTPLLAVAQPIDRHALVTRHNPVVRHVDVDAPLTVGNGGFAFTADITGLQTFAAHYQKWGVPTETQSRWCWVTDENPEGFKLEDTNRDFRLADGRVLGFPMRTSIPAGDWLRKNPRSHPLGQLALEWKKDDGSEFTPDDIDSPEQTLDQWSGVITSKFKLGGVPVIVTTACAPDSDIVAVRIDSALMATGKLRVRLAFPRGHNLAVKNTPGYDWSRPESHTSKLATPQRIDRNVLGTTYTVTTSAALTEAEPHTFHLTPARSSNVFEFTVGFSPHESTSPLRSGEAVRTASAAHWQKFWGESAAVDFSGSTDPRAHQLEERIIRSRYLMAVQMAGDVPPQESGLTANTWYGKHHTEMVWWHTAHFPLWGNDALLAKNLEWYISQLPAARELAKSRGLKGARWAKMTGRDMRESPGGNPLIVWNQPHMVYLAELLYRNEPNATTLEKYRDLVLETADCLATMVHFDEARKEYVLGPPLWIAQEIYDQATSQNPSFELAYWRWALDVAQTWRERLGLPRDEKWDHVIQHLAPIPQKDGKYVALGSNPDTFDNIDSRHDHPTMLGPLGILPGGPDVDRATMERTLDAVLETWDWETKIWGWDYPMIAMTAARLHRPDVAVEILLRNGPNNLYLPSGHCPQRSDEKFDPTKPTDRKREIAVYLPANGGFLSAIALMVAGWDGEASEFPGIPKDGRWKVRAEGLHRLP